MRIVLSSGKSIGKRRAICSGSRPWPIADPFAGHAGGPSTARRDQERERHSGRGRHQQVSLHISAQGLLSASLVGLGRRADRSACHWAVVARYSNPPLRVVALRRSSREIVESDHYAEQPQEPHAPHPAAAHPACLMVITPRRRTASRSAEYKSE